MNYLFFAFSSLLFFPLLAQTEVEPVPHQPLVSRSPDSSSWSIYYTYHDYKEKDAVALGTGDASKQIPLPDIPPETITDVKMEKSGKIYHETIDYSSGPATEIWILENETWSKYEGRSWLRNDLSGLPWPQLAARDFVGLDWISMDHYIGVQKNSGNSVFVFQVDNQAKQLSPVEQQDLKMKKIMFQSYAAREKTPEARSMLYETMLKRYLKKVNGISTIFLDVTTQLPVQVDDGKIKQTYTFSSLSNILEPPPELIATVEKLHNRIKQFTALPTHS